MSISNSAGSLPEKYIIGLFGNEMIIYNRDGSVERILKCPDNYAGGVFDAKTKRYIIASSTSGGDGIHILDLESDSWTRDFEEMETKGKLREITENLETVKSMVNRFESPVYDNTSNHALIIANLTPDEILELGRKYSPKALTFASYHKLTENLDETYHRDKRMAYDMAGGQIVSFAENMEKQGSHFALWAGHGQALYMSLETMEGVLKAAPETFEAFIFAEVVMTNENMARLIKNAFEPLAELCLRYGRKKIIFRNQRLFWNSNCYMDIWKNFLFNPRYREIIVPSMEETHCRTQDISLSGRVGLWLSGVFEHHAGRAVSDNATFSRLWEWSAQQMQHHHLRTMVLHAALGADIFLLNLKKEGFEAFEPFFRMIENGALKIPKRHELLSVSRVCLGMKKPSKAFHEHGNNAHQTIGRITEKECMVFDRLDWYWAGAPIREDDFSRYGFGSRDRMLNFIPVNPYGFIASIPDDSCVLDDRHIHDDRYKPNDKCVHGDNCITDRCAHGDKSMPDNKSIPDYKYIPNNKYVPSNECKLDEKTIPDVFNFKYKFSTDGEFFYDEKGKRHSAKEYRTNVEEKLKTFARMLPVRVEGEAGWVVQRIDQKHVRVVLIDPGYLNPKDRDVQIVLQHVRGLNAVDILSKEQLPISGNRIFVRVPKGVFRLIDVECDTDVDFDTRFEYAAGEE